MVCRMQAERGGLNDLLSSFCSWQAGPNNCRCNLYSDFSMQFKYRKVSIEIKGKTTLWVGNFDMLVTTDRNIQKKILPKSEGKSNGLMSSWHQTSHSPWPWRAPCRASGCESGRPGWASDCRYCAAHTYNTQKSQPTSTNNIQSMKSLAFILDNRSWDKNL